MSQTEQILKKVDSLKEETAEICSKLVQYPTGVPPGQSEEIVAYIQDYFRKQGIETEIHTLEDRKPNIVAKIKGRSKRTILWIGHLDVVPEGKLENWTYPPYSGRIEDDKVWGRGSSDMKGACASAMVAARILNENRPSHNVEFWFTVDEEIGGRAGARWLAQNQTFKGEVAIIGDGGGCTPRLVHIGIGNKGGLGTKLIAKGRTAHGARPYLGDNAIDKLIKAVPYVKRIRDYRLELPAELEPVIKSSVELLLKDENLTETQRLAVKSLYDYPTGPSLNVVNGGVKSNVVPDYAEASFDIRLTPGCDPRKVKERLEELISEAGIPGISVEASASATAGYYEPLDSHLLPYLSHAVQMVTGVKPSLSIAPWGTDAVSIKNYAKIPCFIYGPMIETQLHQPNEYVTIDNLVTAAKVYTAFPFTYGK